MRVNPWRDFLAARTDDYSKCSAVTRLYDDGRIPVKGKGANLDQDRVGPPSPKVLETEIDGDISLYNPANEQVTVLNGTASDVWLLCDGQHTLSEIKHLLASSYQVEEAEISGDVERTVSQLRESGLIT